MGPTLIGEKSWGQLIHGEGILFQLFKFSIDGPHGESPLLQITNSLCEIDSGSQRTWKTDSLFGLNRGRMKEKREKQFFFHPPPACRFPIWSKQGSGSKNFIFLLCSHQHTYRVDIDCDLNLRMWAPLATTTHNLDSIINVRVGPHKIDGTSKQEYASTKIYWLPDY